MGKKTSTAQGGRRLKSSAPVPRLTASRHGPHSGKVKCLRRRCGPDIKCLLFPLCSGLSSAETLRIFKYHPSGNSTGYINNLKPWKKKSRTLSAFHARLYFWNTLQDQQENTKQATTQDSNQIKLHIREGLLIKCKHHFVLHYSISLLRQKIKNLNRWKRTQHIHPELNW